MTFGYGRRVCPGRHVVEGTLLWAMQFERPNGSRGELDVRNYVQSGVTACVFFCVLFSWLRPD